MIENMFHSAAIKLTLWYLAIILALSVSFSLVVYNASSHELMRPETTPVIRIVGNDTTGFRAWDDVRSAELSTGLQRVKGDLILFNLLVLVAGGIFSYYLARRTLVPIEEALETQRRFTGDASHELRTPLTVIQTENEVALRNPKLTRNEAVDLLKSNLEEVAKLKALSDGLLRLSGLDNQLENKTLAVKGIVAEAVSRWEKPAEKKKISIEADIKDSKVRGDRDSLVELVSILLDNAIKYSPEAGQVKVSSVKKDSGTAISVEDQGEGIKSTDLTHIFERFYRADRSRSKQQIPGYGLGLAIAQKIAEAHAGHIEVQSEVGKGSTFTVYLPGV
jgi:two-component system sensor histidine kinase CiaH